MRNSKQLIASLMAMLFFSFILTNLAAQSRTKDYVVSFKTQQFLPENSITAFQNQFTSAEKARLNGNYHVLIQFHEKLTLKDFQKLNNNNITIGDYLGSNAYLATIPTSIKEDQLVGLNTRSISVIPSNAKLSNGIRSGETPQWAQLNNKEVALNVMIYRSVKVADAVQRIHQEGGSVTSQKYARFGILQVSIAQNNINALAENGFVKSVEFVEAPLEHLNHKGPQSTRSSIETTLGGHKGKGIVVGVGDGGVIDHPDLNGSTLYQPSGPAYAWGDHPYHIAGTIAGRGTIDPWLTGMAPEAKLVIDYTSNIILNSNHNYDTYGTSITNNSYGPGSFQCHTAGEYNSNSFWLDQSSLDRDKVLHIFAAGNSGDNLCGSFPYGYGTVLRSYASSKNPLIVGAIHHRGHKTTFSSVGPVKDGRIKPEIVASGFGVASAGRNNNYIAYMGTSMAASTVSGATAIISQIYKDDNGVLPDADVLKAIIMNSADDGGNIGPDYQYGFGMMNVHRASDIVRNKQFVTGTVNQGQIKFESINVPENAHQVKIMLYWNDDPKAGLVTKALVNDMDLEVTNDNGAKYLPYVLDFAPTNVSNLATRQVDTLNNVEQVVLTGDEVTQKISITVKGTDIPFGQRKYVLVYDVIMPEVEMTYPAGGESMVPADRIEIIRWSSYGSNSEDVTLELSLDNGSSWTTMALDEDNKEYKYFNWPIPANFRSNAARFRVTNNVSGKSHMNPVPFTIIPRPKNLSVSSNCGGKIQLTWDEAADIAHYEVFRKDTVMEIIGMTAGNSYLVSGLTSDDEEWFTVRAVTEAGTKGNRITAINVTVDGTACIPAPDVGISGILNPLKDGRRFTSTTLNNQFVEIEITNYGTTTITNFPVAYQLDNQPPVSEQFTGSLAPGATTTFTFNKTLTVTSTGSKQLNVWTALPHDVFARNDSPQPKELTEFDNDYLSPTVFPIKFDFDNVIDCARESKMGFGGLSIVDVNTNDMGGRIHVNADAGYNEAGSQHAITMDAQNLVNKPEATNEMIFTFNVANYDSNWDGLFLDFEYMTHYLTPNPENKVYVRANDSDPWVVLFDLEDSQLSNGITKKVEHLNILDALGLSSDGNKFSMSTSLQVKFVQKGAEESNDEFGDGGYTIDNVTLNIGSILPIELTSFDAVKERENSVLTWQTATELNNSHFNVQVATETVKGEVSTFKTIGRVDGAGTTIVPQAYRFIDEEQGKVGNRYYRLEQVDFDGTTDYSPIEVVSFSENVLSIAVYPNPVIDQVTVQLDANAEGTFEIAITDVTGMLLDEVSYEVKQGLSKSTIELDDRYTTGVYFVNTTINGAYATYKFVKANQ